jgi:NAD(P)-dependent dehydrogenase (short-subunit alcohol dehydrogenase family)
MPVLPQKDGRETEWGPSIHVVEHYRWTGHRHTDLYPQLVDLLKNVWHCRRAVVDGAAPGAPPTGQQGGGYFDRIKARIAMREFGEPVDVANLVTYLCSQQAKYITGQDIHVMGGLDLFSY